ncbi:hypothetical protein PQX77_019378 [Marasmius sp. AFHP31]|nr:hypothetical protein PQX77_019378 [Marasmius sp. AFHP31]
MEDLVGYSSSSSLREESASPLLPSTIDVTQNSGLGTTQDSQPDTMEILPTITMEASQLDTMDVSLPNTMEASHAETMETFQSATRLSPSIPAPVFPESPPVQISLQDAVEVEVCGNGAGIVDPHPHSNASTRPDLVQGSSYSGRVAEPTRPVTSSLARPPPKFVQGSSFIGDTVLSALNPPEHHRVGNLLTFGQWRDMIQHLLANSRRNLPGVLNRYYQDNPFSRPRHGIDEEAQGTAVDMALDRLTLRLIMVPAPFRPVTQVNPDSVGMLVWLYVSAAIEGVKEMDYGKEDVHEALHPFLPNRRPILELMRANPEFLIPFEFGPAVEQLESVNTQKTNGLADLIPNLQLSAVEPGGSVDTAIEFLSEDEDDPESPQNARFPGVVRPRKKKQRPRHVDLANNPFDAVYVDPDRVPIGMEYPDRIDIPTVFGVGCLNSFRRLVPKLMRMHIGGTWYGQKFMAGGIRCRPETSTVNGQTTVIKATCKDCAEMKKPCSNRLHIAARLGALWSLPRYPVNEQTVWDLARRWEFIGVSPQMHLHQSLLNKNNKTAKEHLLQLEIKGNFGDYVKAQQRLQAEDTGLKDIEYWTREVVEGREDRYARLRGEYSKTKKPKSKRVEKEAKRMEVEASGSKVPTSAKKVSSATRKVVSEPDVSESDRPMTRSRGKKAVVAKVEDNDSDAEPLLTVRVPPQRLAVPPPESFDDEDIDVAAPPPVPTTPEDRFDRTRTRGRNRQERAYHRVTQRNLEISAGLAPTRQSTIPARGSRGNQSAPGRRLVISGVEVPPAPYSTHEAGLPPSRLDPVVSSPPATSFGQPRLLFLPSPDPEIGGVDTNVIFQVSIKD